MAPDIPAPEGIARAIAALPASLFVGSVSGPLNAEATTLASKLDPKLAEIQADIAATLELCHPGNEPSAGRLEGNVDELRAGVRSIQGLAASLLNGTYVAPRARETPPRNLELRLRLGDLDLPGSRDIPAVERRRK